VIDFIQIFEMYNSVMMNVSNVSSTVVVTSVAFFP